MASFSTGQTSVTLLNVGEHSAREICGFWRDQNRKTAVEGGDLGSTSSVARLKGTSPNIGDTVPTFVPT
jgi:hypothetical protein